MNPLATFVRMCAAFTSLILVLATVSATHAQLSAADSSTLKPASDEAAALELRRSYQDARDHLQAALQAMASNRAETEAIGRAQSAAITEKLEAMKITVMAERAAWQAERDRQQAELRAERERQQAETQRSIWLIVWVAASLGTVGLAAAVVTQLMQWRAMNRMSEILSLQPSYPTSRPALPELGVGAEELAVTSSNQRLMGVIDRMERRIYELEHTAAPAASETSVTPPLTGMPAKPSPANGGTFSGLPTAPAASAISTASVAPFSSATTHGSGAPYANGASNGNGVHIHRAEPLAPRVEVAEKREIASDLNPLITVALGKAKFFLGTNKVRDAIACYDEVLKANSEHTEALLKKGSAFERLKQDQDALRCYDRAIEVNGALTLAYLAKAGVCTRLGLHDEALECYERAMQAEEKKK